MSVENTVVRAVTIPVSVPLGTDPNDQPWTWQSFNQALAPAFRLSTDLANWVVRRLFVLDDPASQKCPEVVKKWYGYKDAADNYPRVADWAGAKASLQCVIRATQNKYIQQRFDAVVRFDNQLLTYQYPQPFPVHNASWATEYAAGGFPVVKLALPGVGRVELRLKRDGGFRRQLAMFAQLHGGEAKKGEAALYRDRKGQLLIKLVGHFPRRDRGPAENVCFLHTDPNALLVAEVNGRSVTVTNGDHLKRAHAVIRELNDRHRIFLQRAGEDKKREVRMDRRQRANLNAKVDGRCGKQHARVDTAIKQIAAQVARFCERQRVRLIAYDDAAQSFLPNGFAWFALKTRIQQIFVGEMGGEWLDGTGQVCSKTSEERVEWLTKTVGATATAGRKAIANSNRKGSHPAVTAPKGLSSPERKSSSRSAKPST